MPDNPSAWRIDRAKWQATSFDGAGAAVEGGRWNSAGIRVVYASAHLAMAAQERYVHLPKPVPAAMTFVKFRIDFGGVRVNRLNPTTLPAGWQDSPPTIATQQIGDRWVLSGATAILAVTSALIPEEENYLLNPLHPDFPRIVIHPAGSFSFDLRLAHLAAPPRRA
jgi:RES domain-containing protein